MTLDSPLRELINVECRVAFVDRESPFGELDDEWVTVTAIDMPLIQLKSHWGGALCWVNASTIKRIRRK